MNIRIVLTALLLSRPIHSTNVLEIASSKLLGYICYLRALITLKKENYYQMQSISTFASEKIGKMSSGITITILSSAASLDLAFLWIEGQIHEGFSGRPTPQARRYFPKRPKRPHRSRSELAYFPAPSGHFPARATVAIALYP